jgi:hypothetical protein
MSAPPKPRGVLVESQALAEADARRDARLRAVSLKRYKTLIRWLKNPKTKSPFDISYLNKGRGIKIHWSAPFGRDSGPSYLIFNTDDHQDRAEMRPGFVNSHVRLNLLRTHQAHKWENPGEEKLQRITTAALNALYNASWRDTFVHEFTHWQDITERGADKAPVIRARQSPDDLGLGPMIPYLLSPLEFNAYFQQGASAVEQNLKHRIKVLRRPNLNATMRRVFSGSVREFSDSDAHAFVKEHIDRRDSAWPRHFVEATANDPKQRKRFIKRLAGFHTFLTKKYAKDIADLDLTAS